MNLKNMIINENEFMLNNEIFCMDTWSGRYYRLDTPSGFYTRAAREGGLVRKRISQACYNDNFEKCKAQVALRKSQIGGAA